MTKEAKKITPVGLASEVGQRFSLRDYIAIFFPGLTLCLAIFICKPDLIIKAQENKIESVTIFIIGGYFLGLVSNTIGRFVIIVINKFLGDPFNCLINPRKKLEKFVFKRSTRVNYLEALISFWGREIVFGSQINLFFLCRCELAGSSNTWLNYLVRLVTLYNTARSFIAVSLIYALAFYFRGFYGFMTIALIVSVLILFVYYSNRIEYIRSNYRLWYSMHNKENKKRFFYFAYGSNMFSKRLESRIPTAIQICTAVLPDHELKFNKIGSDNSGKCNIEKLTNHEVYGVVYSIPNNVKSILDNFEKNYKVKKVKVKSENEWIKAKTYIAKSDSIKDRIKPFTWYKNLVLSGLIEYGLTNNSLKEILNIESLDDNNEKRRELNSNLLSRYEKLKIRYWAFRYK